MIPAPRAAAGPLPGDLYLDPAVPECERVTMSRNGWTAQVTHLWTGTGWTRIVPGEVKAVPSGQPAPAPRVSAAAEQAVTAWRRRKRARDVARADDRADARVDARVDARIDVREPGGAVAAAAALVPVVPSSAAVVRGARVSLPPGRGSGVA